MSADDGWIDVRKRLPTNIHSVLIYVVGGPGHHGEDFTDIGIYNDTDRRWQMNLGDDDVVVQVSHWRALPEPPAA